MRNERIARGGRMVLAGTAGGAAEVLWIGFAAVVLGVEGAEIARAVAATAVPAAADAAWAPWLGFAVHFLLSLALAAAFVQTAGRRWRGTALIVAAVGALGLVWALNFLIVLPALNPAFTALLPHPVTLVSKLLFGLIMGTVAAFGATGTPVEAPVLFSPGR